MTSPNRRILIYSHDTFGLGHLRRCQAIAHSLVGAYSSLSVIILSGSPIIGSFDFRSRVDFVRVPGVIKLRNGDYTALNLHIDIDQTLKIRGSIIEHTAAVFEPDIFIVDKEPTGLLGEVRPALELLKERGTRLVLGLRDVLDDPEILQLEWERKGAYEAVETLYDDIWVYGKEEIYDPLIGLPLSDTVRQRMTYTGYLKRGLSAATVYQQTPFDDERFILVTPGGGGDGVELVDWVMKAYESQTRPLFPALIVLGPFMANANQQEFFERAQHLYNVEIISFTPHLEQLIDRSIAMVGMGGYNTFCEILSFDKPALLVPRVVPRREQTVRADYASEAGLVSVLPIDDYPDVEKMADALADLPNRPKPSEAGLDNLHGGLDVVNQLVESDLSADAPPVLQPLPV
jgi:predicted glycosyltransferase